MDPAQRPTTPTGAVVATAMAVVTGLTFTAFAFASTRVRAIRAGSPWQDDPHDVVVSFTEFLVPVVVVLVGAAALVGSRHRVHRAASWTTALVGLTLGVDVIAVVTGADQDRWNAGTAPLVTVMFVLVGLTLLTAIALRLTRPGADAIEPVGDWLDDLPRLLLILRLAGPARWVEQSGRREFVRRHVTGLAAALSLLAALLVAAAQAVGEGGLDPALFVLETLVCAAGLFGFCMISNAVLRLVGLSGPPRQSVQRALRVGAIAAAVTAPAALGLRQSIWLAIGQRSEVTSVAQLTGVIVGAVLVVGVLAAASALRRRRPSARRSRTARALLAVACLLIGYVAVVGVASAQPRGLPAPTGPHAVGRATFDWTDAQRVDPLAPQPGTPRELSVWLWYPAADTDLPVAPYAPGRWDELHFPSPWPGLFEGSFAVLHGHARDGAPVAAGAFPLVVLEPGMGLSAPQFSALAEDVASHGYLVAGVTPTYSANVTVVHDAVVTSTPDGNPEDPDPDKGDALVRIWAADARFVAGSVAALDRDGAFAGHVSSTPTVYIGHSFGGAASLQACSQDPHCGGAVDLDGAQFGDVVRTGLDRPFMIVGSENSCVTGRCRPDDPTSARLQDTARRLLAASTGPRWCPSISGTAHFNFTDYAAYYLAPPVSTLIPLGPLDGYRGLSTSAGYLQAFLDHTAHGGSAPDLEAQSDCGTPG